jgi:hypothetical protein
MTGSPGTPSTMSSIPSVTCVTGRVVRDAGRAEGEIKSFHAIAGVTLTEKYDGFSAFERVDQRGTTFAIKQLRRLNLVQLRRF